MGFCKGWPPTRIEPWVHGGVASMVEGGEQDGGGTPGGEERRGHILNINFWQPKRIDRDIEYLRCDPELSPELSLSFPMKFKRLVQGATGSLMLWFGYRLLIYQQKS